MKLTLLIAVLMTGQVAGPKGREAENLAAARKLGDAFRSGDAGDSLDEAQSQYCKLILSPATIRALAKQDGWRELQEFIAQQQAMLRGERVPEAVVVATEIFLAQFLYNRPQAMALAESLDRVADAMASRLVWSGMRGIYWNLRGLVATNDLNYALAIDCHSKALELRRQAKTDVDEAQSLNNLGYLLVQMGDYDAARRFLDKACALYAEMRKKGIRENLPVEIQARMNAARAAAGAQDFTGAAEQLEQLLTTARELPADWREVAECYLRNNLANVRYSLGQFAECERELNLAVQLAKRVLPEQEKELRLAEMAVNLGWVSLATGQVEVAERQFGQAVGTFQATAGGRDRAAEALGYWARAKAGLKAYDESRKLLEEALKLRQAQLQTTLNSALSERDRLAFVQQLRVHPESLAWPGAVDTYLELAPTLSISAADQYRQVLAWKGVLSRDSLESAVGTAGVEVKALEAKQTLVRQQMLGLAAAARNKEMEAAMQVANLERVANDLERQIRKLRKAPGMATQAITIAEVAAALPESSAFLDIIEVRRYQARAEGQVVGDDRQYVGFIVRPGGEVRRFDLGSGAAVDSAQREFVDKIKKRQAFEEPGQALAKLFGQRLREELGPVNMLIVSADGALQHLPWCALPGVQKRYWVEELTLASVGSAQSLAARHQRHGKADGAAKLGSLIVGGVDYGVGDGTWQALTETVAEAAQIRRLMVTAFDDSAPPPEVLTGTQATKRRLLELLPQQRFVHLATHGDFFHRQADAFAVQTATAALDSSLVFAGANADATGGVESLLTAEEVGGLNLRKLDLIVLSACETGLGQVQAGQGQVGLLAALDKAGADAIVTSLWKVDDAATAALMEGLYVELLKTPERLAAAAALRAAQMQFLAAAEKKVGVEGVGGNSVAAKAVGEGVTRGVTRKTGPQLSVQQSHPFYWAAWGVCGGR